MRSYDVLVEQRNGSFRAVIPALPDIAVEGASRDEAITNAKAAAQRYLLGVEVATIQLAEPPGLEQGLSTINDLLPVTGLFKGDEEAMQKHLEKIYAERRRERAALRRATDAGESKAAG